MVLLANRKESLDEISIIKAAAWAWYERGSWFDHKSIPESDFRRTNDNYKPKPSRYKLEAMKKPQNENHGTKHVNSSLLDMYEIRTISMEIDRSVKNYRKSVDGGGHGGRRNIGHFPKDIKSKRKKNKGFWIPAHGVMCGSSGDDVVEQGNSVVRARYREKDDGSMHGIFGFRRLYIS